MTGSSIDRQVKRERLEGVIARAGVPGILLTSHEAVSWYLEGARTHVSLAGPPVLAVAVRPDADTLWVAANEADRLVAEELLPEDAARVRTVPWFDPVAPDAGDLVGEATLAAELRAARASLLPAERDRYRALCREVAVVMTDALGDVTPATTEIALAAEVAGRLRAAGIDPVVILVAGRDRLQHRHPLPTHGALGDRAMLVVCGRRHGMIANATRWVGAPASGSDEERDDHRIRAVEAAWFAATVPGVRLDRIFAAGTAAYADAGFDADEWRRHHQGGAAGYAGRDPRATFATTDVVQNHHAFAWNPSAPGVKVEDTVLVSTDGVEVLTIDDRWPAASVAGVPRPLALPFA